MKPENVVDLESFRSRKKEDKAKDQHTSEDLNSAIRLLIQRMRERKPLNLKTAG